MIRTEIIKAYTFLREHNHTIDSNTIEFMKDASLSVYDSLHDEYCKKCEHNGNQMIMPSGCTGCGSNGEKLHFKLAEYEADSPLFTTSQHERRLI